MDGARTTEAPPPQADPLARPATALAIQRLHAAGHLSGSARAAALRLIRPPAVWWAWTSRLLLILGAALVLAGIVFFFAHNWARMGAFLKLGLIDAAIAAAAVGAWLLGLDTLAGRTLGMAACVLVGVFLAVFGQIYQTGADAWELFAGWGAIILPWVIAARSAPHWLLWLAIADTGIIAWWAQVVVGGQRGTGARELEGATIAALVNLAALAAFEVLLRRGARVPLWLRWPLLASVLGLLLCPALDWIFLFGSEQPLLIAGLVGACLAPAAAIAYYRRLAPDLPGLALAALAASVVLVAGLIEGLDATGADEVAIALLVAIVVTALGGSWAWWLVRTAAAFHRQGRAG